MPDRVHVNYYDESNPNNCSMYTYPIKNAWKKKKSKLTLWVVYDIGGKNYITGEIEPRGYYFYFTNFFEKNISSRKLLLFEVNRKSKTDMERAISYASAFGKEIVSNYSINMRLNGISRYIKIWTEILLDVCRKD